MCTYTNRCIPFGTLAHTHACTVWMLFKESQLLFVMSHVCFMCAYLQTEPPPLSTSADLGLATEDGKLLT